MRILRSAIDGRAVAELGSGGIDVAAMRDHARQAGGPALRALTFHQRAGLLKALAQHLNERRDALYELSYDTGATKPDAMIDIDGGIGTLFVYASKAGANCPTIPSLSSRAPSSSARPAPFSGATSPHP